MRELQHRDIVQTIPETLASIPVTICGLWIAAVFGAPCQHELEMRVGPIYWRYRAQFDGGRHVSDIRTTR